MTAQALLTQLAHLDQGEEVRVFQRLALELTHTWPGEEIERALREQEAA
jgi:hypothetical protein